MTLLEAALDLHAAALAVVPVATDGSKRPAVNWKAYQAERPSEDQVRTWFANGTYDGLGVLTGLTSGNLEMLEVEGRALDLVDELARLLADHGMAELWTRLCAGYLEQSPSGGMHWLYRVDGPDGVCRPNTKLARRPGEVPGTVDVLIETRGEGGFTVTAPSSGRSHPTGQPWRLLAGRPATIPILTVEERDALFLIAGMLDRMPTPVIAPAQRTSTSSPGPASDGDRPGDAYNERATWDDILGTRGWTRGRQLGGSTSWTRPGKSPRDGISATTGRTLASDGMDRLYVFSSSTEFETETPYTKFAAYTLLEHHGDYAAAARQLASKGYGTPRPEPERLVLAPDPAPPTMLIVEGNLATVTDLPVPQRPLAAVAERTLTYSDDANALALVERFGDVLRHCADRGRWYAWDGTVWAPCPRTAGVAREYAKRVARSLSSDSEKAVTWKKKSLSAVGISAMLTQAASDERVAVDYADLDAHAWELNTPGGIVDLRTGRLTPSDPAKLHTRLTSCTPDPGVDASGWLGFLDTTFGGDQELIGYLQRLVGYSAVGLVGAHVLPYCHGNGGNGKGAFLETCVRVLGDYATTAPAGFLMAKQFQGHETEIARLAGARMVLCSEVEEDDRFDEARVKLLTGGDTLTARFIAQDHFSWVPTHQLWSMGNHKPGVRSGGPSFWRRLRLIPFEHSVPEEKIIDDLQGILASEHGPAVLSWIVEGAAAYFRHGLEDPDSVKVATGEYARDQDTVSRFLDEMCIVGGAPAVALKVGIVRSAYESWCHEVGEHPVSAKAFGLALQRHGIESQRTKSARLYLGIALVGDEEDRGLTIEPPAYAEPEQPILDGLS